MPLIKILSHSYQIACDKGEEEKLFSLAEKINDRLIENSKRFNHPNENVLIILTLLILEDQNGDFVREIQNFKKSIGIFSEQEKYLAKAIETINRISDKIKNKS